MSYIFLYRGSNPQGGVGRKIFLPCRKFSNDPKGTPVLKKRAERAMGSRPKAGVPAGAQIRHLERGVLACIKVGDYLLTFLLEMI